MSFRKFKFRNLSTFNQLLKNMVEYGGLHIPADSHQEQQRKIHKKPDQEHRQYLYHQNRRRLSGAADHEHHSHSEMSGCRVLKFRHDGEDIGKGCQRQ